MTDSLPQSPTPPSRKWTKSAAFAIPVVVALIAAVWYWKYIPTVSGPDEARTHFHATGKRSLQEELRDLTFDTGVPEPQPVILQNGIRLAEALRDPSASVPDRSGLSGAVGEFLCYLHAPTCHLVKLLITDRPLPDKLKTQLQKRIVAMGDGVPSEDLDELICRVVAKSTKLSPSFFGPSKRMLMELAAESTVYFHTLREAPPRLQEYLLDIPGFPSDANGSVASYSTTMIHFPQEFSRILDEAGELCFADIHTYVGYIATDGKAEDVLPISLRFYYDPGRKRWYPLNYVVRASVPFRYF